MCAIRRSPKHLEALTASSSSKSPVMRVYNRSRDTLYCRRSICIVSSVPLVATFERILRSLHETAVNCAQPSAVVDSISNLLNDVSMPAPGSSLQLTVPSGTLVCQRPGKQTEYLKSSNILSLINQQNCWKPYDDIECWRHTLPQELVVVMRYIDKADVKFCV